MFLAGSIVTAVLMASMWPEALRTLRNWRRMPTSVFRCSDDRTLTTNRVAKVRAIGVVTMTPLWCILLVEAIVLR
jgi:hypothetical protein